MLLQDSDGQLVPFLPAQILDAADLLKIATDNRERHNIVSHAAESAGATDPPTYVGSVDAHNVKLWSLYDSFVLDGGRNVATASRA